MTINEIVNATQGRLIQGLPTGVRRFSTDSRNIKTGDAFIAICGEKFDGHDFIEEVIKKGCRVVVVMKDVQCPIHVAVIRVNDTVKAFGLIALYHRRQFDIPVIAITGSAGKTTTKEMIASVLQKKYQVLKNFKTENNHMGVPQTLLKLKASHQIAVIEMGTNQFGDIPWLGEIVEPTITVFTNIGPSHLARLGTPEGVFREKRSLLKFTKPVGSVVFNNDDKFLRKLNEYSSPKHKISYGIIDRAKYKAQEMISKNPTKTQFRVDGKNFLINTSGHHQVLNALAAIACGRICGVGWDDIRAALGSFEFTMGRFSMIKTGKTLLIDDTYNANPVSFSAALKVLSEIKDYKKKVVIAGDMLELGKESKHWHEIIGEEIGDLKIDILLAVGDKTKDMISAARQRNSNLKTAHFLNTEELVSGISKHITSSCVILIKGSRRMNLEKIVDVLKQSMKKIN